MCEITIDCIYILYGFIFLCFSWFVDGYINGINKFRKNQGIIIKHWQETLRNLTPEQNERTKGNKP